MHVQGLKPIEPRRVELKEVVERDDRHKRQLTYVSGSNAVCGVRASNALCHVDPVSVLKLDNARPHGRHNPRAVETLKEREVGDAQSTYKESNHKNLDNTNRGT